MKKVTIIMLILQLFLIVKVDVLSAAAWEPPRTTVQNHQLTFLRVRDEYQLRYAINGMPAGTHQVRANFWTSTGTYYEVVFDNPTKIAYLTCNGTYIFEMLDSTGNTIAETKQIKTTKIANPACKSYENGKLHNDLDAKYNSTTQQAELPQRNDVDYYELYYNGDRIQSNHNDSVILGGNKLNLDGHPDGSYTVVAIDKNGNILGSFDFTKGGQDEEMNNDSAGSGNGSGGNGGGENACGDACDWIKSALACPEWDTYMGEWKAMLQEVYQPPNWQEVANIMKDTIVPAMGQELINRSPEMAKIFADEFTSREKPVAPPPTTPPNYTPPKELPKLNDLNQKIEFDLTEDVPVFEPDYTDSEPFNIPDPLDLNLSDTDQGYIYNDVEPDAKDYTYTPSGENGTIPDYEINDELPNDKDYNFPTSTDMPEYNTQQEDSIRYYEGG